MNLQELFDEYCLFTYGKKYKMTDDNICMFFREVINFCIINETEDIELSFLNVYYIQNKLWIEYVYSDSQEKLHSDVLYENEQFTKDGEELMENYEYYKNLKT